MVLTRGQSEPSLSRNQSDMGVLLEDLPAFPAGDPEFEKLLDKNPIALNEYLRKHPLFLSPSSAPPNPFPSCNHQSSHPVQSQLQSSNANQTQTDQPHSQPFFQNQTYIPQPHSMPSTPYSPSPSQPQNLQPGFHGFAQTNFAHNPLQANLSLQTHTSPHPNHNPACGSSYQKILDRFRKLELQNQNSYKEVWNEPIHPSVPIKKYPSDFTLSKIDKFNGNEDPKYHLLTFKYSCYLISNDDALMLRIFPASLAGQALNWFCRLPKHSIFNFKQLANLFLDHFVINIRQEKSLFDLSQLRQFDDEPINDYVSRWMEVFYDFDCPIPENELADLFVKSCVKYYPITFRIQRFRTLKDAIDKARIAEEIHFESINPH